MEISVKIQIMLYFCTAICAAGTTNSPDLSVNLKVTLGFLRHKVPAEWGSS